jgi:predicted O-linked N-acetylglucosamine transferase (SPINDLY family)
LAHYDKALSLKPDYAEAWFNKGNLFYRIARSLDARVCFEKVLALKPDFHWARWAKLFTTIPAIRLGKESLEELRDTFSAEVDQLREFLRKENFNEAHELVGSVQPFYLAYQEENNKDLLKNYGRLCCELMSNWRKNIELQDRINEISVNKKIKIGIVSEQIRNHSVWQAITKGLVLNLDSDKFEIHIFHLGSTVDLETESAQIKATSFTNNKNSLLNWVNAIYEKNINILLYPEIGMDPLTLQLACLRLAPIQVAFWGHPETTGLPTIDYYLSAELFEDEFSNEAYSETLVTLPNLGCSYSKLAISANKFTFNPVDIPANEFILICPGVPFKYAPQYDWILVEIAKRLGKCKLIFFKYENSYLSEILMERLRAVFKKENLTFTDYVLFIEWLNPEDFYGLMKRADIFLDTIGFSGFNTAMQAIECALPIVTREEKFMRGRLANGILKRMGMTELIASTNEAYVELAVRIVQDKEYRKLIVEKIVKMRDVVYDDAESITAFENFLIDKLHV